MVTNLSALYLSLKRLSEVVDPNAFAAARGAIAIASVPDDQMQRLKVIHDVEEGAAAWLAAAKVPTLGELLVAGPPAPGVFFTHYGPFDGAGIKDATDAFSQGKAFKREPRLRARLNSFGDGITLGLLVHPENFTTMSSTFEMTGRHRLFVLGRITDAQLPDLRAQAYLVGHIHYEGRPTGNIADPFGRLPFQMEVHLANVEPLSAAAVELPLKGELEGLKEIPEEDFKKAFAEIIGEPYVPADWGGELSDLVTKQISIDGRPVVTAIAFKGPAKFKPLTVADLGKNGDQIARLFKEAADFVILQHCNKITGPVRDHMRAFATRIGQLKPFCLIDGADSVRILKRFKKLGYA